MGLDFTKSVKDTPLGQLQLLRVTLVIVTVLLAYLVFAAAPVLGRWWEPLTALLALSTSLIVVTGAFLLTRTWGLTRGVTIGMAAWIYLFLGLWATGLFGLLWGPAIVFWVLVAGLAGLGVVTVVSRGRWSLAAVAAWVYILLGFVTIIALGPAALDGLMLAVLWPTMLLWYSECLLPLLTLCVN